MYVFLSKSSFFFFNILVNMIGLKMSLFVIVSLKWFLIGLLQVVVDFTASWCGPCRFIAPFFADLAKKLPNVIFLKVDIDELKVN